MDRFSLMVKSIDNSLLILKSYALNLRTRAFEQLSEILNENSLDSNDYNKITVAYHSDNFIFKNSLIDIKSNYRKFFNTESYLIKNQQVLYDLVDSKHPIFFAIDQQIENSFDKLFSKYTLKSQSFYLLNQYLSKTNLEGTVILLNWQERSYQISILNDKYIVLHKNLKFNAVSDSLYFIVSEIQKLGLNPNDQIIYISGFLTKDSEIFQLIFSYFKGVEFLNSMEPNLISNTNNLLNEHFYYDLLSMSSCE
jgi:hypothetical protein